MRITVIGAGAWGRALGFVAMEGGHDVAFWSRTHPALPAKSDAFILAMPSQAMAEVVWRLREELEKGILISTAKGLDRKTNMGMWETIQHIVPSAEVYALSGPSFADDVLAGLPTAVALAGPTEKDAMHWAKALSIPSFRIYPTDDIQGVELGGALKNVLAIACGICEGQRLGESARASLTTRGFAELMRFAKASWRKQRRSETLLGLAGLGDLLLTCSSIKSRNFAFGVALGHGTTATEALKESKGVVEGAYSASVFAKIAAASKIDMPIVTAVANIVDGRSSPREEIAKLLARPLRAEHE